MNSSSQSKAVASRSLLSNPLYDSSSDEDEEEVVVPPLQRSSMNTSKIPTPPGGGLAVPKRNQGIQQHSHLFAKLGIPDNHSGFDSEGSAGDSPDREPTPGQWRLKAVLPGPSQHAVASSEAADAVIHNTAGSSARTRDPPVRQPIRAEHVKQDAEQQEGEREMVLLLRQELDMLNAKEATAHGHAQCTAAELVQVQSELQRLMVHVATEQQRSAALEGEVTHTLQQRDVLAGRLQQAEAEVEALNQRLAQVADSDAAARAECHRFAELECSTAVQLASWAKRCSQLEEELRGKTALLDRNQAAQLEEIERVRAALEQALVESRGADEARRAAEREAAAAAERLSALEEAERAGRAALSEATRARDAAERAAAALQHQIDQLHEEAASWTAQHSMLDTPFPPHATGASQVRGATY